MIDQNGINSQLDLINILNILHPTRTVYLFFSCSHGTITKIEHILTHKTHHNKLVRMEITQSLFEDHNTIKLELNNRKIVGKSPDIWKLSNTCLNDAWVKEVFQVELSENEKIELIKTVECGKSSV